LDLGRCSFDDFLDISGKLSKRTDYETSIVFTRKNAVLLLLDTKKGNAFLALPF
jgi:hypothetical protein